MNAWKYKKRKIKKVINAMLIIGILSFGLYIFSLTENTIMNFKPSYISGVYLPSWNLSLSKDILKAKKTASELIGGKTLASTQLKKNVLGVNTVAAKSIPVLLYHGVIEKPDGENVTIDQFRSQIFALKDAGYETVSIADFYEFIQGNKQLPEKSFLLTFDDGRKDSYYPVDPILKALDYKAVMFVITKYSLVDKEHVYYLSKDELQTMVKSGRWEIQAHTREGHDETYKVDKKGTQGHYYSNKLWLNEQNRQETNEEYVERIKNDVIQAKNDIERELGIKVISFAYPFGDYGQSTVNFPESESIVHNIVASIYPISFYQVWAGQAFTPNYRGESSSLMKRIEVKPNWSSSNLLKVLEIVKDKNLSYADNFSDYTGWVKKWGKISINDNSLVLSSLPSTTGGSIFLEGSYLWKNYIFRGNVTLQKGQSFSLLARYKDDRNYIACVYSPEYIRIEQITDGKRKQLVEKKAKFDLSGKSVGIVVYNNVAMCYLDNKEVAIQNNIDNTLKYGGVGFQIWDPNIDNSEIVIKEVTVEEIK